MTKRNSIALLGIASVLMGIASLEGAAIAGQSQSESNSYASMVVAQAQSVAIATGEFVAAEAPTTGSVRIVSDGGHRYLEIDSAFSTSEQGPDLHVLLETTAQPLQTYESLGSFVNLGSLSSFSGTQRYPIPDSVDISDFQSVVIWCRMANATFGYAPLQPASSASIR